MAAGQPTLSLRHAANTLGSARQTFDRIDRTIKLNVDDFYRFHGMGTFQPGV